MERLAITWREVTSAVVLFAGLVAGFGFLSWIVGWPNQDAGWPVVTVVAAVIAALPIAGRTLSFLREGEGAIEVPGILKIDFGRAPVRQRALTLAENIVQPGVNLEDTSQQALDEAARMAAEHSVIVIDLKDGMAWYRSRLFALAATAEYIGSPSALIILGQREGKPQRVAGWVRPSDVVAALTRSDDGYRHVHEHSLNYLNHLRRHSFEVTYTAPDNLPSYVNYAGYYQQIGDAAMLRVLVNQMRFPDADPTPGAQAPVALELDSEPRWVTLREVEQELDPWLVREVVELSISDREQIDTILASNYDLIPAVQAGEYAGVVDVRQVERQMLRQLVGQAKS